MVVTMKDIAKAAGVSESTVSLALNNKRVVKENTRNHIKDIARELGYSPNAIAKSLARQRSDTIGLIVPDIENPYYGKLIRCIDEYLMKLDYNLIIATSNDCLDTEKQIINNFVSKRVEGILIAPVGKPASEFDYFRNLEMNDIKYVFVTSYYPGFPSPYVMVDLEKGTFDLVDHLLEQGHREIYFLVGDQETIPTMTRIRGYMKAYEKHDLPVEKKKFINCRLPNFEQAYNETLSLLGKNKQIDAIITINDIMALGTLRALNEHKIKVPQRISVAGYDNVIFSSIATIPITTVQQDINEMAVASVDMLLNMDAKKFSRNSSLLLKPQLIIRESTGPKS